MWWLGANDKANEGQWVDTTGAAVSGYWAGGEPNGSTSQNCAAWSTTQIRWVSEECAEEKPSICLLP